MDTNITVDTLHSFSNRALIITKALLQDRYVELTDRFNRHGYAGGYELYQTDKNDLAVLIESINDELHKRYAYEQAMQRSLDEARAAVREAVIAAA